MGRPRPPACGLLPMGVHLRNTFRSHTEVFSMPSPPPSSPPSNSSADERVEAETSVFPFATASQRDAVRKLTGVLTHHLGTLTSTISGYADLLVDDRPDQEQREIAMNVLEASTRISDLLADLQHYSRSLEPAPRPVSVQQIAQGAVHLLSADQQERVCHRVEPSAPEQIEADPRLLRQALLNLLQNALEASDASDDVLLRVTDNGTTEATTVAFEVWNDGEIARDDPAELFQPFYSTRPQRLGLGLPIATHIAKQHGGAVQLAANNAAEGGTCFVLQI